jgi:hypothetical protein
MLRTGHGAPAERTRLYASAIVSQMWLLKPMRPEGFGPAGQRQTTQRAAEEISAARQRRDEWWRYTTLTVAGTESCAPKRPPPEKSARTWPDELAKKVTR